MWNLEPDDPLEPEEIPIKICQECGLPQGSGLFVDECECQHETAIEDGCALRCLDCRKVYPNDEAFDAHIDKDCERWLDEDAYL